MSDPSKRTPGEDAGCFFLILAIILCCFIGGMTQMILDRVCPAPVPVKAERK